MELLQYGLRMQHRLQVRLWHETDMPTSVAQCPLLGAKRKTCARIELFRFGPIADYYLHLCNSGVGLPLAVNMPSFMEYSCLSSWLYIVRMVPSGCRINPYSRVWLLNLGKTTRKFSMPSPETSAPTTGFSSLVSSPKSRRWTNRLSPRIT